MEGMLDKGQNIKGLKKKIAETTKKAGNAKFNTTSIIRVYSSYSKVSTMIFFLVLQAWNII